MNNKRQTIWLVSMLSLMVILSAYYLFTEDVNPTTPDTEQAGLTTDGITSIDPPQGVEITEVDQGSEEISGAEAGPEPSAPGNSPEDEEVLQGLSNIKGNAMLDQIQMTRNENVSRQAEELTNVISDTKNHTQEEATLAVEELSRLEETNDRITSLQEKLLQDFENAVVSEEETNFKVIVLSDKLEKKQAVEIVDLAIQELNVTPDRITVQYVK